MKNLKKWLISGLAVAAAATMALGLAACNDDTKKDEEEGGNKPPVTETAEISYQFTGHYTDSTLTGMGFDYYVVLNLMSDGSVAGSGYNSLTMDSSPYAENSGFAEKWYKGSWEDTVNEEGLDCIVLNVSYDTDAVNSMTGGQLVGNFEYQLYKDSQGNIKFTLDVPFASGRQTEVTGSATVQYKTLDDFIQGNLYEFEEPEYIAMFQSTAKSEASARLYCQDDGTALFYTSTQDPATKEEKYRLNSTWQWRCTDDSFTIIQSETDSIDATVSGTSATFAYTYSLMGYVTINYELSCDDISVLADNGGVAPPAEEVTTIATFNSTDGDTLEVFSNGTAKAMAFGGQLPVNFTWKYSGGSLVFTDAVNTEKVYTATISGNSATLVYTDTMMGMEIKITFTCDDISAITGAGETSSDVVFTSADGSTLTVKADGTAQVSAYGGVLKTDFTWTYSGGSLVFTDAEQPDKKYTATITGTSATVVYAESFATITFTCDDISAIIG